MPVQDFAGMIETDLGLPAASGSFRHGVNSGSVAFCAAGRWLELEAGAALALHLVREIPTPP